MFGISEFYKHFVSICHMWDTPLGRTEKQTFSEFCICSKTDFVEPQCELAVGVARFGRKLTFSKRSVGLRKLQINGAKTIAQSFLFRVCMPPSLGHLGSFSSEAQCNFQKLTLLLNCPLTTILYAAVYLRILFYKGTQVK